MLGRVRALASLGARAALAMASPGAPVDLSAAQRAGPAAGRGARPLVMLHGLFGSRTNLKAAGTALATPTSDHRIAPEISATSTNLANTGFRPPMGR